MMVVFPMSMAALYYSLLLELLARVVATTS